jgi:hypothetical protein
MGQGYNILFFTDIMKLGIDAKSLHVEMYHCVEIIFFIVHEHVIVHTDGEIW